MAGTETRSRFCINPKLGCDGPTRQTRECNPQNCQGKKTFAQVTIVHNVVKASLHGDVARLFFIQMKVAFSFQHKVIKWNDVMK